MRYIDLERLLKKRSRWRNRKELWKNSKLQKDFRDYFFNKCWYTEVVLIGQDAPIDHFRPKARIDQFEHYNYNKPLASSGYYWLKNEPINYRLCCLYANRKTGEGGKGCFFPLTEGSPLLTEGGKEKEEPILLDPCKQEDVKLISYIGNRIVATSADPIDQARVEVSKKIYNLDDSYIVAERLKVWMNVDKTLAEYQSGDIGENACVRRLREATARESQFSACAIACVNSLAPEEIKSQLDLSL